MKKILLFCLFFCCGSSLCLANEDHNKHDNYVASPPSDIHLLRVRLEGDGVDEHGCNSFLFTAEKNLNFLIRKARWDEKTSALKPGEILKKIPLKKGDACRVRFLVPEGMPRLMICADDTCCAPVFSGLDGSLVLGRGFIEDTSVNPVVSVLADIHYLYDDDGVMEVK